MNYEPLNLRYCLSPLRPCLYPYRQFVSYLFICLISILSLSIQAQSLEIIREAEIPSYTQVSQDRRGQIYLSNAEGVVYRLDTLGKKDLVYAPSKVSEVSYLEAQSGLRIFLFYRELQCYTFLDRFLTEKSQYCLPQEEIGFAQSIALSADNTLWIFDNSRFSLKKYNPQANFIILDTPLDLVLDFRNYAITQMREYQNTLYVLNEKKELLIFDNFGNFQQSVKAKDWTFFNFHEDEIFGISEDKLILINLYKNEERSLTLPSDQDWKYLVASKENTWIGFTAKKMYWMRLKK
jgi:hypothetical protein